MDDSFIILKEIIKKKEPHERFYALFLVKELTQKIYNKKTFDSLSKNIQQRLFIMGFIVKDKESWKDCGIILNKTAKGENYIWGLRFYKLLMECFQNWSIIDETGNIAETFEKLKNSVDICDTMVYYDCEIEDLEERHEVLQNLYDGKKNDYDNSVKNDNLKNDDDDVLKDYDDFKNLKNEYINSLFSKNSEGYEISNCQSDYSDFIKNRAEKMANDFYSDGREIKDIVVSDAFQDIEFSQELFSYLDEEKPDYDDDEEKLKTRKFVYNLLLSKYGDCQKEFRNIIENSEKRNNGDNYESEKNYFLEEENFSKIEIKKPPRVKANIESDLEISEKKNEKLKTKKQKLEEEIKRLEKKERNLKKNTKNPKNRKNQILLSKKPPNSKLIIEEINEKNREYNILKNKYNSLLYEMNNKIVSDTNNSYIETRNMKKTFEDSMYNIERMKNSNNNRSNFIGNNRNSYLGNNRNSYLDSQSYLRDNGIGRDSRFIKKSRF